MHQNKKTFIMLCGVPASGKSTWVQGFKSSWQKEKNSNLNMSVVSTDDIIDTIAKTQNLTYNDLFGNITYSFAEKMMYKIAEIQFGKCDVIVWDQTNLTVSSRNKKMQTVPKDWYKIAVFFPTPSIEEHQKRLQRPGKKIPENVLHNMINQLQIPTTEEGFDKIFVVENTTNENSFFICNMLDLV